MKELVVITYCYSKRLFGLEKYKITKEVDNHIVPYYVATDEYRVNKFVSKDNIGKVCNVSVETSFTTKLAVPLINPSNNDIDIAKDKLLKVENNENFYKIYFYTIASRSIDVLSKLFTIVLLEDKQDSNYDILKSRPNWDSSESKQLDHFFKPDLNTPRYHKGSKSVRLITNKPVEEQIPTMNESFIEALEEQKKSIDLHIDILKGRI